MTIVVDTSVLIDHLRGHEPARRALRGLVVSGERLAGAVLTRTEILAGLRPDEYEATSALLGAIDWVPVDEAVADRAGELARRFLRSHPAVDTVDYVIAATAEALDATLWTLNVRHFPMFTGLRPPY